MISGRKCVLLVLLGFWVAGLFGCGKPYTAAKPPIPLKTNSCLKLLTYNIRVGAGIDHQFTPVKHLSESKKNLKSIAEAIRSIDPDVIALQEVKGAHQAAFLANLLHMNYAYSSHNRKGLEWGLALLTRFTILDTRSEPIHNGRDQRIGGIYCLDTPQGRIVCINIHYYLSHYAAQVRNTTAILDRIPLPVILMGDLNFSRHFGAMNPLLEKLIDTCTAIDTPISRQVKQIGTVSGPFAHRIDYILVDPAFFEVDAVGLIPEKYWHISDHKAYFACVRPKVKAADKQE
jgi:endonuclease/exonuclease/phosphatase family metal-dependent hydrolase